MSPLLKGLSNFNANNLGFDLEDIKKVHETLRNYKKIEIDEREQVIQALWEVRTKVCSRLTECNEAFKAELEEDGISSGCSKTVKLSLLKLQAIQVLVDQILGQEGSYFSPTSWYLWATKA